MLFATNCMGEHVKKQWPLLQRYCSVLLRGWEARQRDILQIGRRHKRDVLVDQLPDEAQQSSMSVPLDTIDVFAHRQVVNTVVVAWRRQFVALPDSPFPTKAAAEDWGGSMTDLAHLRRMVEWCLFCAPPAMGM